MTEAGDIPEIFHYFRDTSHSTVTHCKGSCGWVVTFDNIVRPASKDWGAARFCSMSCGFEPDDSVPNYWMSTDSQNTHEFYDEMRWECIQCAIRVCEALRSKLDECED